jgi:oligoendopeptidase F
VTETQTQTETASPAATDAELPRWSIADVHESLRARSFTDALERAGADVGRLRALFDEHDVRAVDARPVDPHDGEVADEVIRTYNDVAEQVKILAASVYATVSTDSRDELAQSLYSEIAVMNAGS